MSEALVSTVIPVFNRPQMLREAVQSVIAQSWRPIEIVVVDDGSTDNTMEAAHALAAEHPGVVRVLSQPNAGPGAARQRGLEAARGEFIQFLDSDDLLLPDKFRVQVAALRADPQAGICYGNTLFLVDGMPTSTEALRTTQRQRTIFPALLAGRLWITSTPLYRRSVMDRIGPWPARRQMEDWEFDAQAGAAGICLHYLDAQVDEYRDHTGPRLAHAWTMDKRAMADRVAAHLAVYEHALRAGVDDQSPEMRKFARALFLLARQSGAAGLPLASRQAFDASRSASGTQRAQGLDFRLYRAAAAILGWRLAGRAVEWLEAARRGAS